MNIPLCLIPLVFVVASSVCGQSMEGKLSVRIPQVPQRVLIDGKPVIYYELQLRNESDDTLHVKSVAVSGKKPLLSIKDKELESRITNTVVPPQRTATLYIEIDSVANNDSRLNNRVEYTGSLRTGLFQVTAVTQVSKAAAVALAPPLGDGPWAAIYSPVWARGHRRMLFPFDGVDYLPGRFAIDFVRLDSAGRYAMGNEDSVANWYGYNQPVLAVAAGVVVAVRTDFNESPTLSGHPTYAAADATGNFVAVDIGHGHVVLYEHLKPGSIHVSRGEKVKERQVLGAIGFTGQSTGPHLHLHVANGPMPLRAEGLPFVFKSFQLIGRYPDFGVFGKSPWLPARSPVTHERPAPNTVIHFRPLIRNCRS